MMEMVYLSIRTRIGNLFGVVSLRSIDRGDRMADAGIEVASATPKRPKLPVFRTVGRAYALTFANIPTVLRLTWAWLVMLTAGIALLLWFAWPEHHAAVISGDRTTPALEFFGPWLLSIAVGSSVAVGWHRFILLDDKSTATIYARFDSIVVRYLLLSFIFMAPALLVAAPAMLPNQTLLRGLVAIILLVPMQMLVAIGVLAFAIWVFVTFRLSLALPAIALHRTDVGIARAYRATAGNFWRIFWSGMIVTLPVLIVIALLGLFASGMGEVLLGTDDFGRIADPESETFTGYFVSNLISEASGLLLGILAVTTLSLQFRHFFPDHARPA